MLDQMYTLRNGPQCFDTLFMQKGTYFMALLHDLQDKYFKTRNCCHIENNNNNNNNNNNVTDKPRSKPFASLNLPLTICSCI